MNTKNTKVSRTLLPLVSLGVLLAILAVPSPAIGSIADSGVRHEMSVEAFEDRFLTIDIRGGGRFKYQMLFEVVGPAGQSMDDFAASVAPLLRTWSDGTAHEACGVIATDGQRFGIQIGSAGSHIGCTNFPELVPEGMRTTGITIHSHGTDQRFNVSAVDIKLMGETYAGGSYGKNTRRNFAVMGGQSLNDFSDADYTGGAGYLAGTDGKVLFQDGKSRASRLLQPRDLLLASQP